MPRPAVMKSAPVMATMKSMNKSKQPVKKSTVASAARKKVSLGGNEESIRADLLKNVGDGDVFEFELSDDSVVCTPVVNGSGSNNSTGVGGNDILSELNGLFPSPELVNLASDSIPVDSRVRRLLSHPSNGILTISDLATLSLKHVSGVGFLSAVEKSHLQRSIDEAKVAKSNGVMKMKNFGPKFGQHFAMAKVGNVRTMVNSGMHFNVFDLAKNDTPHETLVWNAFKVLRYQELLSEGQVFELIEIHKMVEPLGPKICVPLLNSALSRALHSGVANFGEVLITQFSTLASCSESLSTASVTKNETVIPKKSTREINNKKPDNKFPKTPVVCFDFLIGECKRGPKCHFPHREVTEMEKKILQTRYPLRHFEKLNTDPFKPIKTG